MLRSYVPIIHWLHRYKFRKDFAADVVAGFTIGIMHIPQGMAYASLAGLDPVYGLYSSFFPPIFYMFFGTSRHISLGVAAVVSLMTGSVRFTFIPTTSDIGENGTLEVAYHPDPALPPGMTPIVLCTSLTLLVGLIQASIAFPPPSLIPLLFQLGMGMAHLGFVSAYLSDQVVSGFTTGSGVHVLTAQLNKILGVPLPRFSGPGRLISTYRELALALPETRLGPVLISVFGITVLVICKVFITPRVRKISLVPIPFELILIVLTTLISHYCNFERDLEVHVVGEIPAGFPVPSLPPLSVFRLLWADAIGIAVVSFGVSVGLGKIFAKKHGYQIEANQELYALGLTSCLSSLFSCYPPGSSLSRSCVFEAAGARSQLATVFSSVMLIIVLLWVGPLFYSLPMCILSCIIVVALKGIFQEMREVPKLWATSRIDLAIWVVSFLGAVLIDVQEGLILGIVFAMLTLVFRTQSPDYATLGRLPHSDAVADIARYRVEHSLGLVETDVKRPIHMIATSHLASKV